MPPKKATRQPRAVKRGSSGSSRQLEQLRATVKNLRERLIDQAGKRKLELRVMQEAKSARGRIAKEVAMLKEQGRRLTVELKKMLTESERRRRARDQALAKVADLRADVARKSEELRRKSAELARLAHESAQRAREILSSERLSVPPSAAEPPEPPSRPAPEIVPSSSET